MATPFFYPGYVPYIFVDGAAPLKVIAAAHPNYRFRVFLICVNSKIHHFFLRMLTNELN